MERINVASFFCGCGGMDLRLMGDFSFLKKYYAPKPFKVVFAIDNDNFSHKCIVGDVQSIQKSELPNHDLLIGGFPCQSFSISAQNPPRLGFKDDRGKLFFEMVDVLKEKQPRFFIAENVKGILSANKKQATV